VSAIKYQVRELLPSLVSKAQGIKDAEAKSRFKFLKLVTESKKPVDRRGYAYDI
jgi:hypothetical protein